MGRRSTLAMLSTFDDVSKRSATESRGPGEWLEDAIARDPALGRLLPQLRRLAANAGPVLIFGEPGTGAELVARAIHDLSRRAGHPFVVIDCASLSEPLIQAELLGVDRSSESRPPHKMGTFEQAGVGTVLLALGPEAEELLQRYRWPGNLRELRETVEEAALQARNGRIGPEHLPEQMRRAPESGPLSSLRDVEMRHIERVLQEARGNQRRASRILGISRWSLSRRLRKYGMQPRSEG